MKVRVRVHRKDPGQSGGQAAAMQAAGGAYPTRTRQPFNFSQWGGGGLPATRQATPTGRSEPQVNPMHYRMNPQGIPGQMPSQGLGGYIMNLLGGGQGGQGAQGLMALIQQYAGGGDAAVSGPAQGATPGGGFREAARNKLLEASQNQQPIIGRDPFEVAEEDRPQVEDVYGKQSDVITDTQQQLDDLLAKIKREESRRLKTEQRGRESGAR